MNINYILISDQFKKKNNLLYYSLSYLFLKNNINKIKIISNILKVYFQNFNN